MGTKQKPGKFDCYTQAADDEPLFTLRANDPLAATTIRFWLRLRWICHNSVNPLNETNYEQEQIKLEEAEKCAVAMEQWRESNGKEVISTDSIMIKFFKYCL